MAVQKSCVLWYVLQSIPVGSLANAPPPPEQRFRRQALCGRRSPSHGNGIHHGVPPGVRSRYPLLEKAETALVKRNSRHQERMGCATFVKHHWRLPSSGCHLQQNAQDVDLPNVDPIKKTNYSAIFILDPNRA